MSIVTYAMSDISKQVGWKGEPRKLPPVGQIRVCLEQAKNGDRAAAVKLLTWYRFCKSPKTFSEVAAVEVLSQGCKELLT